MNIEKANTTPKEWYKSYTLWFNVLTIGLEIFQLTSEIYIIPANTTLLINGIGNILLRYFKTYQPIK